MALIDIQNLRKKFQMGLETINALAGVSFKIDEGEFVSIVGASGSGKSTLMNILGLLDRPTQGRYLLDGKPTETLSDDEISLLRNQKIGFVFQSFNLLPRASALRNVEMPLVYSAGYDRSYTKSKMTEMAVDALQKVALGDRMSHKPNELSGGQRQRVAIARALVNLPRLILADEPTGNLDSRSGREILELFHALNRGGVTIVLVTHDPLIAAQAHRVISMSDGSILKDEIKARNSNAHP